MPPHLAAKGAPTIVSGKLINLIYFLAFLGNGSLNSGFLVLYLSEVKHLSLHELGLISALRPACTFLGSIVWTSVADGFSLHSAVYTVTTLAAVILRCCIIVAPSLVAVVLTMVAAALVGAGSGPMLDGAVLATMVDATDWGKHRLWGAVGYGIAVLVVGLLIDHHGFESMFAGHAALVTAAVVVVRMRLPMGRRPKRDDDSSPATPRVPLTVAVVRNILCSSTERTVFFLVVFLCGIGYGVTENFLFLYLRELRASNALIGLGRAITCASEVPMFWYAPTLIRKLGSLGVLALACACYIVRFLAYSQLEDPRFYLAIEPLHGITYAVMWNASAAYAFQIAPAGLGTTAQGLLSSIHFGLGQGVGALLGGFLYASVGARAMFQLVTLGPALSLVLIAWSRRSDSAIKLAAVPDDCGEPLLPVDDDSPL